MHHNTKLTTTQKQKTHQTFKNFQCSLHAKFCEIDPEAKQHEHTWQKPNNTGGGTSLILRGELLEKAGINFSQVYGDQYPRLESEHRGKPYYATGVSTICHPANPHAPIGHMNVRLLEVDDTFWLGGGADLTPFLRYEQDTNEFHHALRSACDKYTDDAYTKFSKWCDDYFFLKHRNSRRGVGGVFFDYLQGEFSQLFAFVVSIAHAYADVYPRILARRVGMTHTDAEREGQLSWRGRYVEFNLLYDRGTQFGLQTGGDVEAILVSLPPLVKW